MPSSRSKIEFLRERTEEPDIAALRDEVNELRNSLAGNTDRELLQQANPSANQVLSPSEESTAIAAIGVDENSIMLLRNEMKSQTFVTLNYYARLDWKRRLPAMDFDDANMASNQNANQGNAVFPWQPGKNGGANYERPKPLRVVKDTRNLQNQIHSYVTEQKVPDPANAGRAMSEEAGKRLAVISLNWQVKHYALQEIERINRQVGNDTKKTAINALLRLWNYTDNDDAADFATATTVEQGAATADEAGLAILFCEQIVAAVGGSDDDKFDARIALQTEIENVVQVYIDGRATNDDRTLALKKMMYLIAFLRGLCGLEKGPKNSATKIKIVNSNLPGVNTLFKLMLLVQPKVAIAQRNRNVSFENGANVEVLSYFLCKDENGHVVSNTAGHNSFGLVSGPIFDYLIRPSAETHFSVDLSKEPANEYPNMKRPRLNQIDNAVPWEDASYLPKITRGEFEEPETFLHRIGRSLHVV